MGNKEISVAIIFIFFIGAGLGYYFTQLITGI